MPDSEASAVLPNMRSTAANIAAACFFRELHMVQVIKHDLEFILKQIKIAEAHAAGGDLATLVAEAGGVDPTAVGTPSQAHLLPYGLRTVDGSYNNLIDGQEEWGASDN